MAPRVPGVLLCSGEAPVRTLLEGGTGSQSMSQSMPDFLPDRLEAGTHNVPGIAGLLAGVRYVQQRGRRISCCGSGALPSWCRRACGAFRV